MSGIKSRVLAKKLEQGHIDAYFEENGALPRGNPERRESKFDGDFSE